MVTKEQFNKLEIILKEYVKDFPESIDLKVVFKTGAFKDRNKNKDFKEFYITLTGNVTVRNACNCMSTYTKIIYDYIRLYKEYIKNNKEDER